jgi:hypothetical protein
VIRPEAHNLPSHPLPTPISAPDIPGVGRTPAENCARAKGLGYVASKHITMYGERLELISDPVEEVIA